MKKIIQWLAGLSSLVAVLAVVVIWLPAVLQDTPGQMAQGQAVSPIETPSVPIPTPQLEPIEPPTETPPPMPPPLPTPVVTPIPLAEPPFLPLPGGGEEIPREMYTLVVRDDDVLRAVPSDGTGEQVLVDIRAQTPLYLGRRSAGIMPFQWGQVSPDGKQLALVLTNSPERNKSSTYSIYLYDTTTRQMKLPVESAMDPAWSPDGTRLAYRDIRIGHFGLKILDLVSGQAHEVMAGNLALFTWSPDGRAIAFTRTLRDSPGEIWTADATGASEPVQLTPMEMYATDLNWSPAGDKLLFVSHVGEHVTPGRPHSLWTVGVATKELRQLTQNIFVGDGPAWSPDGAWIAFTGTNMLEGETPPFEIWLVASDGSDLKRLTQDPATDLYPAWVSGRQVVFLKRDSEAKQADGIWEIDLVDGTFKHLYPQDREFKILR